MADSSRSTFDPETLIDESRFSREESTERRRRAAFIVSGTVSVVWLIAVTAFGLWDRIADHGVAAGTMVVGSFVAGATPQGGGAVAFPVFTKALNISSETARSFSLSIQTVGMTAASVSILIRRSPIVWRAVGVGALCGVSSFILTLVALADWSQPFAPMAVPGPFVKVTFSLIVLAMTSATIVAFRTPIRSVTDNLPYGGRTQTGALIFFSTLGGIASALLGSGADVMIYLFLVVILGIRSTVGVPTSVLTMTVVSIVGFVVMVGVDNQFAIEFAANGDVLSVGGDPLSEPLAPRRADLFGMWIAAAPIVAWGAPLGALVASRIHARTLTAFVIGLGALEVVTTVLFLPELRESLVLAAYGVLGGIVGVVGVLSLARHFAAASATSLLTTTLTRDSVEVSSDYREDIDD